MFDPASADGPDFATAMRAIEMREMEPTERQFHIEEGVREGRVLDLRLTIARKRWLGQDDGA